MDTAEVVPAVPKGNETQEVYQIVLEPEHGEDASDVVAPESAGGGFQLLSMSSASAVHENEEDSAVTYIQVEESEMAATLLKAMGGEEDESKGETDKPEPSPSVTTLTVEVSERKEEEHYLLQSHPNYKLDLLQAMSADCGETLFDLPVFCSDGPAFSSRVLLAAASPMMKGILSEFQGTTDSCLVIPELTRAEFITFQKAVFAKEGDIALDFITLIKVAETLGAEISLTTDFAGNDDPLPEVDYRLFKENCEEERMVLRSLGYDVSAQTESNRNRNIHSSATLAAAICPNPVKCETCQRWLTDEESLRRHRAKLHSDTEVTRVKHYECNVCKKSFVLEINLKAHKWLCHRKAPPASLVRPATVMSTADTDRALSKAALKLKREQEKHDDMKCRVCGKTASSWKVLHLHMMDHTNLRPYKCEQCGRGFKEPQKLRRHMIIHSGEKRHVCGYCGKAFGLPHNLRSHEKIHLGLGCQCGYCGKMFSQGTNLRDHESQHKARKHQITQDEVLRKKQTFEKKRGRPSIQDLDKRKAKEQEEKQKKEENGAQSTKVTLHGED